MGSRFPELPNSLSSIDIESMLPAPPPFLPFPRKLILNQEGMSSWHAYGLRGRELVGLGDVYGEDEDDALESAKEAGEGQGFSAYKVVEA